MWLHSVKVAQLLRSAACLHTNQSQSYLNHLVSQKPVKVYQRSKYVNGTTKYRINSASLFVGDIERARHGDFSEDPKFKVQYD